MFSGKQFGKQRDDTRKRDTIGGPGGAAYRPSEAAFQEGESKTMPQTEKRDWGPVPASSDLNALLGRGSEFDGKLSFEGTVRIDGTFTGEISTSDTLIVGEGARVQAEISCGSVVVHGEVTGNIKAANGVELHRPAKVRGDITTPSLSIEKGVLFEGRSKMDDVSSNVIPLSASGTSED